MRLRLDCADDIEPQSRRNSTLCRSGGAAAEPAIDLCSLETDRPDYRCALETACIAAYDPAWNQTR